MRTPAKPRRRVWPWIVAIVVALIVGIAVNNTLRDAGVGRDPDPTTEAPVETETTTPVAEGVTGCLGGPIPDAAMVVAAQEAAPRSSDGGIEVATAFVRWLTQYPYPGAEDIAVIENGTFSADAPTTNLDRFFATEPNLSGGKVADGQTYQVSTLPGVFHLESSSDDEVVASIGTGFVIDGQLDPTKTASITVTVSWEDDRWKFVSSEGTRSAEELYSIGRPFTAGC